MPEIVEDPAATRDDRTPEPGTPAGRTIDRMRQDLIAEARRAKQQADANAAAEQQKAARTAKPTDRRKAVIADAKPAGRRAISRNTMVAAVLLLIAIPALVVAVPRLAKKSAEPAASSRPLQQKMAPSPSGEIDQQKGEPAAADPARRSEQQEPAGSAPQSQIGALPDTVPGIMFANADKSLSDEQIRRAYEQHSLAEHSSRLASSATGVSPAALAVETPPTASAAGPASGETAGKLELPPASVGPLSLRTAAANGDPSAQFEVGARLAEGRGIDQNFTEAARWYQRAASQGFAQAQYRLATLYERGLGLKKDLARARTWYQRAAEAGNVKAMHNLAVLSAGRTGEAPDYQTASRWFERAAGLGLADSQYNLAVLFENGLGVAQDKKRAYQWYALAARSGDKESLRKRDALKAELSVGEAAEVDRSISDWRAEASDRLANDPRAAGEDWKKRQGADANG
jgi:localization factor PodJL